MYSSSICSRTCLVAIPRRYSIKERISPVLSLVSPVENKYSPNKFNSSRRIDTKIPDSSRMYDYISPTAESLRFQLKQLICNEKESREQAGEMWTVGAEFDEGTDRVRVFVPCANVFLVFF